MSETKTGVVKSVFGPNDFGFYKVKLTDSDKWYGLGKKKPAIERGDSVSFEFYLKDDKYPTVKGEVTKTASAPASSGVSSGPSSNGMSKEEWAAKDARAERGYAIIRAIEFLQLAQSAGALDFLSKAKAADKLDLLTAAVIDRAEQFTAFATGTPKKAAPTEAEQEQAGGDDEEAME